MGMKCVFEHQYLHIMFGLKLNKEYEEFSPSLGGLKLKLFNFAL